MGKYKNADEFPGGASPSVSPIGQLFLVTGEVEAKNEKAKPYSKAWEYSLHKQSQFVSPSASQLTSWNKPISDSSVISWEWEQMWWTMSISGAGRRGDQELPDNLLGSSPTSHPLLCNTCPWAGHSSNTPALIQVVIFWWAEIKFPPGLTPFSAGWPSLAEGTTPGAVTASGRVFDPLRGGAVTRDHPCAHVLLMAATSAKLCFALMKNISSEYLLT